MQDILPWLGGLFAVVGLVGAVLPSLTAWRRSSADRDNQDGSSQAVDDLADKAGATDDTLPGQRMGLYARFHRQALSDSSVKSTLGNAAASIGFLVILVSVALIALRGTDAAWLGTISGVVCEAVAALFFTQERAAKKQAARMFELLNASIQRREALEEAERLAEKLDGDAKNALLAKIAEALMAGRPADPAPADELETAR